MRQVSLSLKLFVDNRTFCQAKQLAVNSRFGKLSTAKIQEIMGKDPQTKESHN